MPLLPTPGHASQADTAVSTSGSSVVQQSSETLLTRPVCKAGAQVHPHFPLLISFTSVLLWAVCHKQKLDLHSSYVPKPACAQSHNTATECNWENWRQRKQVQSGSFPLTYLAANVAADRKLQTVTWAHGCGVFQFFSGFLSFVSCLVVFSF